MTRNKTILAAALLFAATPSVAATQPFLFSVTTAYETSGNCATIQIDSAFTTATGLQAVGSDPVVRYAGEKLYVLNRSLADNIQILDPALSFATQSEVSTGPGSNPQDIVVIDPSRSYVSRYESAWLYEMNPATGAVIDSIDLSPFADTDGLPEMSRMARRGDLLFVQLQRLDRNNFWTPVVPGMIAVIDITTNLTVDADGSLPGTQAISLSAGNPNGQMTLDSAGAALYVSLLGAYGVNDGGIEKVNTNSLASEGWVTTETDLGGDVGPFAMAGNTAYAIVSSDFFYTNQLVTVSVATGAKLGTILSTTGFVSDLEYDDSSSLLFLADRDAVSPGVRVVNTVSETELTTSPISTGLPPFDLVVVSPIDVGIAGSGEAGSFPANRASWAQPNPFRSSTELFFRRPGDEVREIDIYDPAGRLVRRLEGNDSFVWDGRTDGGDDAGAGVYFYRPVRSDRSPAGGRVVLVR